MRVLIDIGHPAHVHLFKHFAWETTKKGHDVTFTTREKEFDQGGCRFLHLSARRWTRYQGLQRASVCVQT